MTRDENEFISHIEKGCESWRRGDDYEGLGHFQSGCLLWLDSLEQEEDARTRPETFTELTRLMEKLMDRLDNNDIIHATDVLEYEILPLLKSNKQGQEGVTK